MNKFLTLLALMLTLAPATSWAIPGTAAIGALTTNPAANAVLVTSAALSSGGASAAHYLINVTCTGSVAFTCAFQVMNGASIVSTVYLNVPAGQTVSLAPVESFAIPNGDTLRAISATSITGQVQANIFYALEVTD